MTERFLSAEIHCDDVTPELSVEVAMTGIDIVKTIAPWIRIEKGKRVLQVGHPDNDYVSTDAIKWPKFTADLNVVLTKRRLVYDEDLHPDGRLNHQKLSKQDYLIGIAFPAERVMSRRVALIDTSSIKRPEHIVAHEIGHLLGIKNPVDGSQHCEASRCLMSPALFVNGKADRTFCECCSQQLHDNSLTLRRAKSGRFAMRNSRIF